MEGTESKAKASNDWLVLVRHIEKRDARAAKRG